MISRRHAHIVCLLFIASILLPQGVGFKLPGGLPNMDLPRLAIIALQAVFLAHVLYRGKFAVPAPRTLLLLFALTFWQIVSAYFSASPSNSLMWALGNGLSYWGFGFALIVFLGSEKYRPLVVKTLTLVGFVIAAWSTIELLTQHKLVPYRNIWSNAEYELFSTALRRRIPTLDRLYDNLYITPYMSIGPFANQSALAAVICALGGFTFIRPKMRVVSTLCSVGLFALSVLGTQSRAGILAAFVMILLSTLWSKPRMKWAVLLGMGIATLATFLALTLTVGKSAVVEVARYSVQDAVSVNDETGDEETGRGFYGRFAGLMLLLSQMKQWWLFGFGPGSLLDADRVQTSIALSSDPGSFFVFFFESGLPAGLLLTAILLNSVIKGLKSEDLNVRAATLGIIGFGVTSLSSIVPHGWGITIFLAGLIESWSREKGPTKMTA